MRRNDGLGEIVRPVTDSDESGISLKKRADRPLKLIRSLRTSTVLVPATLDFVGQLTRSHGMALVTEDRDHKLLLSHASAIIADLGTFEWPAPSTGLGFSR